MVGGDSAGGEGSRGRQADGATSHLPTRGWAGAPAGRLRGLGPLPPGLWVVARGRSSPLGAPASFRPDRVPGEPSLPGFQRRPGLFSEPPAPQAAPASSQAPSSPTCREAVRRLADQAPVTRLGKTDGPSGALAGCPGCLRLSPGSLRPPHPASRHRVLSQRWELGQRPQRASRAPPPLIRAEGGVSSQGIRHRPERARSGRSREGAVVWAELAA